MKISFLSEYPHHVAEIAQWYFDEWADPSSSSIDSFVEYMEEKAVSNLEIPLSFIAHVGGELLGAVELKFREHNKYPEYEHWLGSLYVDSKHRSAGVGAALINRTKSHAVSLKLENLYLQCEHDLVSMYEKYGFKTLHKAKYGKFDTIIMDWDVS